MSVTVRSIEDDGVVVLACEGELNGLVMAGGEGADLGEMLGKDWAGRRIALDMSGATYMDSAAVGWLLSLHKSCVKSGGKLVICGIQPVVRRVIELMRIDQVLPIADDAPTALTQLRKDA